MPADKITNTIFGIPGGIFALGTIVVLSIVLLIIRQSSLKKKATPLVAPQGAETESQTIHPQVIAAISAVVDLCLEESSSKAGFVVTKVTQLSNKESWGQVGQVQNTQ